MSTDKIRAEIIVNGLVQGVGFRYYVQRKAQGLGLRGYVKNLYSGDVLTVAEGEKSMIEELIKIIKAGPSHAHVKNCRVDWFDNKNEFTTFEITF
jgi:acylphosphatase